MKEPLNEKKSFVQRKETDWEERLKLGFLERAILTVLGTGTLISVLLFVIWSIRNMVLAFFQ